MVRSGTSAMFLAAALASCPLAAAGGDAAAGRRNTVTCNGCHGQSAMKSVPVLGGQSAAYVVLAMRAYQDGVRPHPTMRDVAKGFSERDFRNFAAWYAQPGPERPLQSVVPPPEQASRCAACHGADGSEPVSADVPRIAGQRSAFITTTLREYRDGTRKHPVMSEQARDLTDADIAALAAFFTERPGLFLR